MEGVGARLGRSSTRYGPATVFTGPVRKWKKKWVHVSPSSASNHHSQTNGNNNGNNGSHLLLYKWTPISQSSNNGTNADKSSAKDSAAATAAPEEPPRRKFKYIPVLLSRFLFVSGFEFLLYGVFVFLGFGGPWLEFWIVLFGFNFFVWCDLDFIWYLNEQWIRVFNPGGPIEAAVWVFTWIEFLMIVWEIQNDAWRI